MFKKRVMNNKGYVSIETIVVVGLLLSLGSYLLFKFGQRGQSINQKSNENLIAVGEDMDVLYDDLFSGIKPSNPGGGSGGSGGSGNNGGGSGGSGNNGGYNPGTGGGYDDNDDDNPGDIGLPPELGENPNEDTPYEHIKDREVENQSDSDFIYIIADDEVTIVGYKGTRTDIVVPFKLEDKPVTYIADYAFAPISRDYENGKSSVVATSVIIPNTIVSIGSHAFYRNDLVFFAFPESVRYAGIYAFAENKIRRLYLYEGHTSVMYISDYTFSNNKIDEIEFPSNIEVIGNHAFENNELDFIILSNNVKVIGDYAFNNNNMNIVYVKYDIDNYDVNITIGDFAFNNNNLSYAYLPYGVRSVGRYTFANNNIREVYMPETLTSLSNTTFKNNPNIRYVLDASYLIDERNKAEYFNSNVTIVREDDENGY